MKIKISIKNRWTGSIIFEFETENNTMAKTIAEYVRIEVQEKEKYRANLTDANLTDADLTRANLTDANLTDANLTRANLTDADLTRANLTDANLTDANLTDANLTDANLTDADLTRANLTDADLTRANLTDADLTREDLTDENLTDADLTRANLTDADLTRANLTDADLTRANLTDANLTRANLLRFKNDFWRVLLIAKNEIPQLRQSLVDGKINGSKYEGDCCCLKGTIANAKHCAYNFIPGLKADISEPSEQWFLQIKPGQTPKTSNVVKLTVEWLDEFVSYLTA